MKIITSMLALLFISGCGGFDLAETAKDEAMLRELSRIDFRIDDIKVVREDGRLTQIDPVLRPEFREKITICHNGHKTLTIEYISWLLDHREHGDTIGACLIPQLP